MRFKVSLVSLAIALLMSIGAAEKGKVFPLPLTVLPAAAQTTAAVAEKPLPPEQNPPGDIPDNQVFITYASILGGYRLKVPEGWARTTQGTDVMFTQHFDGLSVALSRADSLPSVQSVRHIQAQLLKKRGRAVVVKTIRAVQINDQFAVLMRYQSNSVPNPITDKQVRLENATYFFYRAGKVAALRLWAPLGADNVDQWRLISHSFRWR